MSQNLTLGTLFTGNASSALAAINQMKMAMRGLVTTTSQTSKAAKGVGAGFASMGTAAQKSGKHLSNYSKQISKVHGGFERLLAAMKVTASYAVAGGAFFAIVQGLKAAGAEIVNYDQALKNLQAITRATSDEVTLMGEKITDVARTTKFSSSEVAEGMTLIGQAGFNATESLATIQAVANLATGTLSEFKSVSDLVTTTIRAFGLNAAEAGRVSDVMANAINRSKLNIDKLRIAFNYIGAASHQAGLALEETAASAMVLANNGLRASTVGTGLRQVLARLLAPNRKLRKAFEEAGIALNKVNPSIVGYQTSIRRLIPVLYDAEKKTVDMAKAYSLFGLRGAQAAAVIVSAFVSGDFQKALEMVNEVGSAEEMAAIQAEGLGVKFKNLADRAKIVARNFAESGGLVDGLHAALDVLKMLMQSMDRFTSTSIGKFTAGMATLTPVLIALGLAAKFASKAFVVLLKVVFKNPYVFGVSLAVAGLISLIKLLNDLSTKAQEANKKATAQLRATADSLGMYKDKLEELKEQYDKTGEMSKSYAFIVERLAKSHSELGTETELLAMGFEKLIKAVDKSKVWAENMEAISAGTDLKYAVDALNAYYDQMSKLEKLGKRGGYTFGEKSENLKKQAQLIKEVDRATANFVKRLADRITAGKLTMVEAEKWLKKYVVQKKAVKSLSLAYDALRKIVQEYNKENAKVVVGMDTSALKEDTALQLKFLKMRVKYETDAIAKLKIQRKIALAESEKNQDALEESTTKHYNKLKVDAQTLSDKLNEINRESVRERANINASFDDKERQLLLKRKKLEVKESVAQEMLRTEKLKLEKEKQLGDSVKLGEEILKIDLAFLKKKLDIWKDFSKSQQFLLSATPEQYKKMNTQILKMEVDLEKQKLKIRKTTRKQTEKDEKEAIKDKKKNFKLELKAVEKFSLEWYRLWESGAKRGIVTDKEFAAAREEIRKKALDDISQYEQKSLEEQKQRVISQGELYVEIGQDRVAVGKWVTDELAELEKEYWEKQEGFIAGIMGALSELEDMYRTLGRTIAGISKSWTLGINTALEGSISESLTASIRNLFSMDEELYKDYWKDQKQQIEATLPPLYKKQKAIQAEIDLLKNKKELTDKEKLQLEAYKKELDDVEGKIKDQEGAMKEAVAAMEKAYDGLGGHLKSIWDKFLTHMIDSWIEMIAEITAKWVAANLWKLILSGGKSLFTKLFPALSSGIGGLFEKLKKWWDDFTGATKKAAEEVEEFKKKKLEELKALKANNEELEKGTGKFKKYAEAVRGAAVALSGIQADFEGINDEIEDSQTSTDKAAEGLQAVVAVSRDLKEATSQDGSGVSGGGIAATAMSIYTATKAFKEGDYVKGGVNATMGAYGAYSTAVQAGMIDKVGAISAAGPYLQGVGGAYSMYQGIKGMKEGDYVGGGIQTGVGAYNVYQGYLAAKAAYTAATTATTAASGASGAAAAGTGLASMAPAAAGGVIIGAAIAPAVIGAFIDSKIKKHVGGAYWQPDVKEAWRQGKTSVTLSDEQWKELKGAGVRGYETVDYRKLGAVNKDFQRNEEWGAIKQIDFKPEDVWNTVISEFRDMTRVFAGNLKELPPELEKVTNKWVTDFRGSGEDFAKEWSISSGESANLFREKITIGHGEGADMFSMTMAEAAARWEAMSDRQRFELDSSTREAYQNAYERVKAAFTEGSAVVTTGISGAGAIVAKAFEASFSKIPTTISYSGPTSIGYSGPSSISVTSGGRSAFDDQRINVGPGAAEGGIYSGPSSGYLAWLHGVEKVYPVKSNPEPLQQSSIPRQINMQLSINGVPTRSDMVEISEDMVIKYNVKADNDYRLT